MQRTNQFNTTTRRRSQPEIEALLDDERYGVYVASLRDRFGDLGVVAAVVVEVGTRTFDSFIMSCRAMGFGLESAVLHDVMARHEGGPFVGLFIPTARNAPAADLWERSGFRKAQGQDDEGCWVLDGDRASWPQVPDWFRGS
jgi:FkbH-like protein